LIALAVAHTTQCVYCIEVHTKNAKKAGASKEEVVEAVFLAAALRAGGAACTNTGSEILRSGVVMNKEDIQLLYRYNRWANAMS